MQKWLTMMFLLASSTAFTQAPLTLEEAYQLALKKNERVAIQEEEIRAQEAKLTQAVGSVLPNVRFQGQEFVQDDSATAAGAGQVGQTLTRFSTPQLKFNAKQPIFQGLREFHALAAARSQKRATAAQWEQAKRLLFLDVVQAFYSILQIEQETRVVKDLEKNLSERLRELKTRVALGKSRVAEQNATEADLAAQQANLAFLEESLENAKDVLAFLTGISVAAVHDDKSLPAKIPESQYVTEEVPKRPDIRAAEETLFSRKSLLSAQRGEFLPVINAEANYYAYRVGFLENVRWDALFTVELPLFQGGRLKGKLQEAKVRVRQSMLELEEKKRRANLEVKKAYHDFTASQKQALAFEKALAMAEKSYRGAKEDFHRGLIDNLEVLSALFRLEDFRRSHYRALIQARINHYQLKVAAGEPLP